MLYYTCYNVSNNSCCEFKMLPKKMLQYLLLVLIIALIDGYSFEVQEWKVVDFE